MDGGIRLVLLDGDVRRRAQISHGLQELGTHVEPFEDVAELIARWPRGGVILAYDDGDMLAPLIDHMSRSAGWLPVIAFAVAPETRQVVRAMQGGVVDYLVWPFADGELIATLAVARERGEAVVGTRQREATARNRVEKLSNREREVLTGVATGLSNDLIARSLGISSRTVEIHRANMLNKIGANHTSEAIRVAIDASLVR